MNRGNVIKMGEWLYILICGFEHFESVEHNNSDLEVNINNLWVITSLLDKKFII